MKFAEAIPNFTAWQSFHAREGTLSNYRIHLMQLGLYMHNCDIESVTLGDIIGYLKGMEALGWDEGSFMTKTLAFRKFFKHYRQLEVTRLDYELIPVIERPYKMPTVAKPEDYGIVLNSIPEKGTRNIRNKTLLMMYKDTGTRLNELLSLDVSTLDLVKFQAVLKTEKTKKVHPLRKVFWTTETNEQLKKWLEVRVSSSDALFVSIGNRKEGERLMRPGATCIMRKLSRDAGLKYTIRSHSLRHLFGHDMAKKKFPDTTISTMLGHKSPVSSYIYTMLNEEEMGDAYRELRAKI